MRKLLFVEDDLNLSSVVVDNLEELGFDVTHVLTGEEALLLLEAQKVDIVLMDVELPGSLSGFDTAEIIRKSNAELPIIFATARQSVNDLERGFRIKKMDYIKKPYRIKEISLRIDGLIGKLEDKETMMSIGRFSFDPIMRRLKGSENEWQLSKMESDLLQLLCENLNMIVCRDKIVQTLWDTNEDPKGKESSVHNLIYLLRKHLKGDPSIVLEVVSKKGYRITIMPCIES